MKKIITILLLLLLPMVGSAQTQLADEWYNKGKELFCAGQYAKAIEFFHKCDSLDCVIDSVSHHADRGKKAISDCLLEHAYFGYKYGDIPDAIKFTTQAMQIRKDVYGEEHPLFVVALNNLAYYNAEIEDYDKAIEYEKKVVEIHKKVSGEESNDYVLSLNNLATYYFNNGNYDEYLKLGVQVMNLRKKLLGEEHPDYLASLKELSMCYADRENYTEAIKYEEILLEKIKLKYGENHSDYVQSLQNLSRYCSAVKDYTTAIKYETKLLELSKAKYGRKHRDIAESSLNLAYLNLRLGDNKAVAKLTNHAAKIGKKNYGLYYDVLNDCALYNAAIGKFSKTLKLENRLRLLYGRGTGLGIMDPDPFNGHTEVISLFCYIAMENCAKKGNYAEAIRIGNKALETFKLADPKDCFTFISGWGFNFLSLLMHQLAKYNYLVGNYPESEDLDDGLPYAPRRWVYNRFFDYKSVNARRISATNYLRVQFSDSPIYLRNDLSYNDAIRIVQENVSVSKIQYGEGSCLYHIQALTDLIKCHSRFGNDASVISIINQIITKDYYRNYYGYDPGGFMQTIHCSGSRFWYLLYYYYNLIDSYNFSDTVRTETLNAVYQHIRDNIEIDKEVKQIFKIVECERSVLEREYGKLCEGVFHDLHYAWRHYSKQYSRSLPWFAYNYPEYDTLTSLAYNGQILSKNFLLNTEQIFTSASDKLSEYKEQIRRCQNDLSNFHARIVDSLKVDSLSKIIQETRLKLSQEVDDCVNRLFITWQDIQNNLKSTDIAIEFADFYDKKEHIYVALIIKKGMDNPELVKLDFSDNNSSDDYTTPNLYNAIWKPLEKHLQSVENVYFSPCGAFHTIAIESLPDDNGEIFAQKYNTFRLSSTREIVFPHKPNLGNTKAATFGGIRYDLGPGNWEDIKTKDYENYVADLTAFRDVPDLGNSNLRTGVQYLKGTEIEAKQISSILRDSYFQVSENNDIYATEESFKKLSGSGLSVLHIATHGFYKKNNTATFRVIQTQSPFEEAKSLWEMEDISLSQSGLLLAGANCTIDPGSHGKIPEGFDDGILTAKEISRMDLKDLDLVVLSACETGLGEVTSEGVFGLQRGFKKAGANTIVMSLWKVDDNATQDFMTEFYKNLVSGKSKREAFLTAQAMLRSKYKDPRMWAAFVMVDGVE